MKNRTRRCQRSCKDYYFIPLGRGRVGPMVIMLTFYSDDPSLNSAKVYLQFLFCKSWFKRTKINEKEAGYGYLKRQLFSSFSYQCAFDSGSRVRNLPYSNCKLVKFSIKQLQHLLGKGGSHGLVVIRGDPCSEGHGFESQHRILDGHFFTDTYLLQRDYNVCLKRRK